MKLVVGRPTARPPPPPSAAPSTAASGLKLGALSSSRKQLEMRWRRPSMPAGLRPLRAARPAPCNAWRSRVEGAALTRSPRGSAGGWRAAWLLHACHGHEAHLFSRSTSRSISCISSLAPAALPLPLPLAPPGAARTAACTAMSAASRASRSAPFVATTVRYRTPSSDALRPPPAAVLVEFAMKRCPCRFTHCRQPSA